MTEGHQSTEKLMAVSRLAVLVLLVVLSACRPPAPPAAPVRQATPLEVALRAAAGGGDVPPDFQVIYSDMHGMHGGTTIRLAADGTLASQHMQQGVLTERAGRVPADSVRALIGLLVELQAWEQRTPPRPPVPDESAAGLRIQAGGEEARIWEWFNDMGTNQRLSRILGMLRRYVSQTPAAPAG
jgi:hypothetical protein